MSQVLYLGKGVQVTVDRVWRNNGEAAEWAMVGSQRTQIRLGTPAKPTIFQRGNQFFYENLTPVNKVADVDWFPEPYRTTALKFVESGKPIKLATIKKVKKPLKSKKADKPIVLDSRDALEAAGLPAGTI